jgi:hypothetical protein
MPQKGAFSLADIDPPAPVAPKGTGAFSLSDIDPEPSTPPQSSAAPAITWMPQNAGIRPPLSFAEHLRNLGRDAINSLPTVGTIAGGMIGDVPGAAVGAMAGRTAQNLVHALGVGDVPPPESPEGEFGDVGLAGIKGAAVAGGAKVAGKVLQTALTPATGQTATSYIANLVNKARYGSVQQQIEQKLAPSSIENKAIVSGISEQLAKDPDLAQAAKGPNFDRAIFKRFTNSRAGLDYAEAQVPQGTVVAKQPILQNIDQAIDKLQVPGEIDPATGQPFMISGHPDAVAALQKARGTLDKFPDQIPFQDLRKFRIQLDQAIKTSGGWKETANAADKASAEANRFVTNSIRGELAQSAPVLSPANTEYSLMHKAMESGGLSFDDGRRLADIGKVPPPSPIVAATKAAARATVGGYGVYKVLNILDDLTKRP